jgi:hypothetical protein
MTICVLLLMARLTSKSLRKKFQISRLAHSRNEDIKSIESLESFESKSDVLKHFSSLILTKPLKRLSSQILQTFRVLIKWLKIALKEPFCHKLLTKKLKNRTYAKWMKRSKLYSRKGWSSWRKNWWQTDIWLSIYWWLYRLLNQSVKWRQKSIRIQFITDWFDGQVFGLFQTFRSLVWRMVSIEMTKNWFKELTVSTRTTRFKVSNDRYFQVLKIWIDRQTACQIFALFPKLNMILMWFWRLLSLLFEINF